MKRFERVQESKFELVIATSALVGVSESLEYLRLTLSSNRVPLATFRRSKFLWRRCERCELNTTAILDFRAGA